MIRITDAPLLIRRQLAGRAFSGARSFEIPHRSMILIRHAAADFVYKLPDTRHLVEVDLVHGIRHLVIVRMQSAEEKNNRNALGRVAEVIAPIVNSLAV